MARQFQIRRCDQDVKEGGDYPILRTVVYIVVVDAERREQHRVLQGEVVLGVVVDALQPRRQADAPPGAAARTSSRRRRSLRSMKRRSRCSCSDPGAPHDPDPAVELGSDQSKSSRQALLACGPGSSRRTGCATTT